MQPSQTLDKANRRQFLTSSSVAAVGLSALAQSRFSPNDRINIAVVGIHGRGKIHYRNFAKIPQVRVAALCDVDERLFADALAEIEQLAGYRPSTEIDIRKLLERKDIDAVSIAAPDYWHALMTIWACQAGKDVYVEKPVSFTVAEGRKMVEAARKYGRIVQAGNDHRSIAAVRAAIRFLHAGSLGKVYCARVEINRPRTSIGRVQESSVPEGVHWDLYLGPSQYRPFTLNHFHYGWHFFWDTATGDVGNTGVHTLDVARWGLKKDVHPIKIHSAGGIFVWDTEQETPNLQFATMEYADGSIIEYSLTNLYAPPSQGNVFCTSEGYLTSAGKWKAFRGKFTPRSPDVSPNGVSERATNVNYPTASYAALPPIEPEREPPVSHFENFIACVRSRKAEDLYCEVNEGHMSAALCHLANISFRVGRKITFDPASEKIIGDPEASALLTRTYRAPYLLPDKV